MRLRGIMDPAELDQSMLRAVEVMVNCPGDPCKVSARIPGGVGPLNGWITEYDENPVRAMMRAYLKAMRWPDC